MLQRNAYQQLVEWKHSRRRKPLLIKGMRQVGKTHLLRQFGKAEYDQVVYFNFEENEALDELFQHRLSPSVLIEKLSIAAGQTISPSTLIIFDEIQQSNHALSSLKYFCEEAPEYPIAAAGSLLGVKLSRPNSFPVGKVNFLELYPLTFFEFLGAVEKSNLREMLEQLTVIEALPKLFHQELIDLLKQYYFVGGMPEAVFDYAQNREFAEVRVIQQEIIKSYELDFAKHAPPSDVPKLSLIWNSIHSQLAKENKKFLFNALKKSARGREYEQALQWLLDAGLILRCTNIKTAKFPLSHYEEQNVFKLYYTDIGLLGAMSGLSAEILIQGNRLFEEFHGAFVENYTAQQLTATSSKKLYYWTSLGKKAEVDFLIESTNQIYPLEVKAGINTKSKSLQSYGQQFHPSQLLRATLLNLQQPNTIRNLPLYLIPQLQNFLE